MIILNSKNINFDYYLFNLSILPVTSQILKIRLNKNIKFYSNTILTNRVKGPKTITAPELNNFKKEAILGLMLGDLTADKTSLNGNTRLRFFMSIKNKDYMNHLYNLFKLYIKTSPKIVKRTKVNKLTNLLQTDIWCSTLRYSLFNWVITDFNFKNLTPKY